MSYRDLSLGRFRLARSRISNSIFIRLRIIHSTRSLLRFLHDRVALPDANPNHWRLGIFYFNRQDRRLFVPKRRGFGWTLNFANIWAWLLVGLIIFVLIARLLNRGVKGRV